MFALARALLSADAIDHDALARALLAAAREGTSLARALVGSGGIDPRRLERHLARGQVPYMQHVVPVVDLARALPTGLCERLLALPVRRDPMTGTIDVAVVDPRDAHAVEEIAYWLSAPVRMVQTSLTALEAALARVGPPSERGVRSLAPPIWVAPEVEQAPPTSRHGALGLSPADEVDGSDERVAIIELGRRGADDDDAPQPASSRAITARGPFVDGAGGPAAAAAVLPSLFPRPAQAPAGTGSRAPSTRPGPPSMTSPSQPSRRSPDPRRSDRPADGARDAILDRLVGGVGGVAERAVVFAVRRDGLVGWTGSPGLDRDAIRALRWPPHVRTTLHAALTRREAVGVRIPGDAVHAPLVAALRLQPGQEIVLAAVHADGRPVAVLLADGAAIGPARAHVEELARSAGLSFAQLLRERAAR